MRQDVLDIHPGIAETFRRRIERLTAVLDHPDDAAEATAAIREVIDRIVITPGPTRRDFTATLQGELGTIHDWIERTGKLHYKPAADAASARLSVSVKTRAWHQGLLMYEIDTFSITASIDNRPESHSDTGQAAMIRSSTLPTQAPEIRLWYSILSFPM